MKYFTYDLWKAINSCDEKTSKEADIQWQKNSENYEQIFNVFKNKLQKKFLEIYDDNGEFHDWHIEKVEILDAQYNKQPVKARLLITDKIDSYIITYNNVTAITIEYNRKVKDKRGFDDWGYSEFLPVDEKYISHEILFASGASILFHFETISIEK